MIINYQGKSYFKLHSGEKVILIDPSDQRSFRGATLVINTTYPSAVKSESEEHSPFFIDTQGEYDISDVRVYGKHISSEDNLEKNAYTILFDEMKIGIIPPLKKEPDIKDLELLENCDILFLPIGSKEFLSITKTASIARQLEPSIIIPYFINTEENPKELFRELGKEAEAEEKINIRKKDINYEDMEIRWIKSKKNV